MEGTDGFMLSVGRCPTVAYIDGAGSTIDRASVVIGCVSPFA